MPIRGKPTLCVDFDGVIHDYKAGWQGGEIYGEVTPGFFTWAAAASQHFILAVYSSRSKDEEMRAKMAAWLSQKLHAWYEDNPDAAKLDLIFAVDKPAAWLTIDDRCIRFDGDWRDPALQPDALLAFLPWMHRPAIAQEG